MRKFGKNQGILFVKFAFFMFSFSGLPSVRVPSVSVEPFEYTWFTVNHGYFQEVQHS